MPASNPHPRKPSNPVVHELEIASLIVGALLSLGALFVAMRANSLASRANAEAGKANVQAREANRGGQAALLVTLRDSISAAKQRVHEANIAYELVHENKVQHRDMLRKALLSALEDLVNAYDIACGQYLDGRVDKIRFRKDFVHEITALIEDVDTYGQVVSDKHESLHAVYDELMEDNLAGKS